MKELIKAATKIAASAELQCDREDWACIANCLTDGDLEGAATLYHSMDTASRDLIAPYAKDPKVKPQAAELLRVSWIV